MLSSPPMDMRAEGAAPDEVSCCGIGRHAPKRAILNLLKELIGGVVMEPVRVLCDESLHQLHQIFECFHKRPVAEQRPTIYYQSFASAPCAAHALALYALGFPVRFGESLNCLCSTE